ncbi:class F sortase [Demequina sp. NBRC 110051]|uniref:class F sortase n=1 Tax=Demequina sp. NBRC 110051 TaxID=1570340 RepID=UPI000A015A6B|nr:class F sortase [Demequina sp. NBRC 110051]
MLSHPRALVVCAFLAVTVAGCAGGPAPVASGVTLGTMPSQPSPSSSVVPPVDEVTAPHVLGDVEVRSASPAELDVAPVDQPVRLEVAGLDIDMPVVRVGVDETGGMVIPEGALTAGWYEFGPAPGDDAGNAVVAAHVDNAQGLGPFARLLDVEVGERVDVTTESGATIAYEVTDVEQTNKDEVDLTAVFEPDGPPSLVMVTCGGDWQANIGHYADNVIVTAIPVDDVP